VILKKEDHFSLGYLENRFHSWVAKARHVLPSGLSLPLASGENGTTDNDDIGWVVKSWHTD
jgi:hypothetical protein